MTRKRIILKIYAVQQNSLCQSSLHAVTKEVVHRYVKKRKRRPLSIDEYFIYHVY